jgi:hypothetical protein
MLDCDNFSA